LVQRSKFKQLLCATSFEVLKMHQIKINLRVKIMPFWYEAQGLTDSFATNFADLKQQHIKIHLRVNIASFWYEAQVLTDYYWQQVSQF